MSETCPADPATQTERPARLRWQTSTRHYTAAVEQDLFGDWIFMRIWGGRGSSVGGYRVRPAANQAEALLWLHKEAVRRVQRGYHPVAA